MCPLNGAGAWLLLLGALGLAWQAKRYTRGSTMARLILLGWAVWLGSAAWLGVTGQVEPSGVAAVLAGVWLLLLLATAWVIRRDWRAATQARRAAEAAIDRQMQAALRQVFDTHPRGRDEP